MNKIVLLAFNGELMCFSHVMLYAIDMNEKGHDVKVIIEGSATSLITGLNNPEAPFGKLYLQLKKKGLIACICRACSQKMGTLEEAERQGLNIVGDMQGHPSIEKYLKEGYQISSF